MKSKLLIFCLIVSVFSSCTMFGKTNVPYLIDGNMRIDESTEYTFGGLELKLLNKSEKSITSFTLVFFMFDSDGNIPAYGRSSLVLTINAEIAGGESFEHLLSLDKYLVEVPEEPYQIDYMYLSKIVYENGEIWTDPFGTLAFN